MQQQQMMMIQAEKSMSEPAMGDYEQQSMGAGMTSDESSGGYGGKQQSGYGKQSGMGGYGKQQQQKYEEPQVSLSN